MARDKIRIGIGGWTYEPWRGTFYPQGLPHARELAHAAERLGAIEINSTFYSLQKPESFRKWAAAAPDGFVFTVKASRYCTNRKVLGEAGEAIERFVGQGLTELGDKLGPILWQFMHTKRFEQEDFAAFLKLLPAERDGVALRHALEVRHESFVDPVFLAMARDADAAVVFADKPGYPTIADQTGSFTYARLQDAREDEPTGYDAAAIDHWAQEARQWAAGGRDVFIFMINGAKVRAPAAAEALIARLAG
ncbi:DUF72 domain-containing protein [Sphingomonas sp. LaA6.9]|uniref:DUF72 domain-containing protein n=1 Tax=Sphingomonas sp. LaA6.9 TaxID=2919914 RepID=UPI001F4F65F4|nr:DUF72 domain-containing protein [Sphingomonas sp. LaA6.9]MCJ8156444.1 DUF72 domain-containing protein [Sphingomonas sp. LaA6.9]